MWGEVEVREITRFYRAGNSPDVIDRAWKFGQIRYATCVHLFPRQGDGGYRIRDPYSTQMSPLYL